MDIEYIRNQREIICFPVVNRGVLWYNKLLASQQDELNMWYEHWLEAPETMCVPQMPNFLQEEMVI